MARVLRAPLLHFLLLGGALLALRPWWRSDMEESRPRTVIGADDLERLRETWTEEHGSPPSRAAEDGLVRDAIDEESLYGEVMAFGFDRRDVAVRRRLVLLRSIVGEEAGGDRDNLERE